MSVDKFGHYYNSKLNYNNNILRKNESKNFGIILDSDKNLNFQNKRIKNVASPIEDNDSVTKDYLLSQINQIKKDLLLKINKNEDVMYNKISNINQNQKSYIDGELELLRQQMQYLKTILLKVLPEEVLLKVLPEEVVFAVSPN